MSYKPADGTDMDRADTYAASKPSWQDITAAIAGKSDAYKVTYLKKRRADLRHLLNFMYHNNNWTQDAHYEQEPVYELILKQVENQLRELEQMHEEETPWRAFTRQVRGFLASLRPTTQAPSTTAEGQPTPADITDVREDKKGEPGVEDAPDVSIPDQTTHYARQARPLLSDYPNIESLIHKLVEDGGGTRDTIYKWLCRKNPHYPGDSSKTPAERYEMLKGSVLHILRLDAENAENKGKNET